MNIDFAYENYYAEGSYFAVNVFMKEIEDYHGADSYTGSFNNVPDVFMSRLAQTSFLAGQCPGQGWVPGPTNACWEAIFVRNRLCSILLHQTLMVGQQVLI